MNWTDPSPVTGDQLKQAVTDRGLPAVQRVARLVRAATVAEALELAPEGSAASSWTPTAGVAGTRAEVLGCFLVHVQQRLRGAQWSRAKGRAETRAVQRRDLAAIVSLAATASASEEHRLAWPSELDVLVSDRDELPGKDPALVALYPAARRELELVRLSKAVLGMGATLAAQMGQQPHVDEVRRAADCWHGELQALAAERSLTAWGSQ